MSENNGGPIHLVRGVVEGALGIVKQLLGIVFHRDDLKEEGQAQQDKAAADRKVAAKEAEAEKARGQAKLQEKRKNAARKG